MRKTPKVLISVVVALAFAASIICCCTAKAFVQGALVKPACQHCPQKTAKSDSSKHECCLVKASAAEEAPVFTLAASVAKAVMAFEQTTYAVVKIHTKFNLAYLNGPPGPISSVPLYIQSRSIRV